MRSCKEERSGTTEYQGKRGPTPTEDDYPFEEIEGNREPISRKTRVADSVREWKNDRAARDSKTGLGVFFSREGTDD